jgi:hypothetical protein
MPGLLPVIHLQRVVIPIADRVHVINRLAGRIRIRLEEVNRITGALSSKSGVGGARLEAGTDQVAEILRVVISACHDVRQGSHLPGSQIVDEVRIAIVCQRHARASGTFPGKRSIENRRLRLAGVAVVGKRIDVVLLVNLQVLLRRLELSEESVLEHVYLIGVLG